MKKLVLMFLGGFFLLGCSQMHLGKSYKGIQVQVELPVLSSGRNALGKTTSSRAAAGSLYQVQATLTAVSADTQPERVLQSLTTE